MPALILVDFENGWVDKSAEEYVGDISDVLARTNKLIDFCRPKGFKIIFIRHVDKDSDNLSFAESLQTYVSEVLSMMLTTVVSISRSSKIVASLLTEKLRSSRLKT